MWGEESSWLGILMGLHRDLRVQVRGPSIIFFEGCCDKDSMIRGLIDLPPCLSVRDNTLVR